MAKTKARIRIKIGSPGARAFWALFLLSIVIFTVMLLLNVGVLAAIGGVVVFWLSAISVMALINWWRSGKAKLFFGRKEQPGIVRKSLRDSAKELFNKFVSAFKETGVEIVPPPQPKSADEKKVEKVEKVEKVASGISGTGETKEADARKRSSLSSDSGTGERKRASSFALKSPLGVATGQTTISPSAASLPSAELALTGKIPAATTTALTPELAKPPRVAGGELLSSSPKKVEPVVVLGTIPIASAAVFATSYRDSIERLISKKTQELRGDLTELLELGVDPYEKAELKGLKGQLGITVTTKKAHDSISSSIESKLQRRYAKHFEKINTNELLRTCIVLNVEITGLKEILEQKEPLPLPPLSNISSGDIKDTILRIETLASSLASDSEPIFEEVNTAVTLAREAVKLEELAKTPEECGKVVKEINQVWFDVMGALKGMEPILRLAQVNSERANRLAKDAVDDAKSATKNAFVTAEKAKIAPGETKAVAEKEKAAAEKRQVQAEKEKAIAEEKAAVAKEKFEKINQLFDQLQSLKKIMSDKNEYYFKSLEVKLDVKSASTPPQPSSKAE